MKKLTKEEFVRRATEVHNGKYDYSKVEYKTAKDEICIICPIHGEFWQTAGRHLYSAGCKKCYNDKRSFMQLGNLEDFIKKAQKIHGNKYDYSLSKYEKSNIKIAIVCRKHGVFYQTPNKHLTGRGCPICAKDKYKKKLYGVGVFDGISKRKSKFYSEWSWMITRCYSEWFSKKQPNYSLCSVCEDWLLYSNFEKWFDSHYVDGWQLDKDILIKGNKVYSPSTCCFVPREINNLFVNCNKNNRKLPIGVSSNGSKFLAYINRNGKQELIGCYDTKEDAFSSYKIEKEKHIKAIADKWKKQLDPNVYNALYNYKVEITD